MNRLQSVMNAAAHLVYKSRKYDHVTHLLSLNATLIFTLIIIIRRNKCSPEGKSAPSRLARTDIFIGRREYGVLRLYGFYRAACNADAV